MKNYKLGINNKGNYTLWLVFEPEKMFKNQYVYNMVTLHSYQGVLGKKESTVEKNLRKRGINIPVEVESLYEGKVKSFREFSESISSLTEDQFTFGKLIGEQISTSDNIWYLETQASKINEPQSEVAKQRLVELGNHIEDGVSVIKKPIKDALDRKSIIIVPDRNISCRIYGNYEYFLKTEEYGDIVFSGELKFKEMWYNGFAYYLPQDEKGSGKKIKGKTLLLKISHQLTDGGHLLCTDLRFVTKKELELSKVMDLL